MSDLEPDGDDDALTRLPRLDRAKHDAIDACHYRTATRIAQEIKRLSKDEHNLGTYLWALHTITNHSSELLDPESGREAAIELIACLESEDRARVIQPNLDQGEYEHYVARMSSCAYDNLAKATAQTYGYNSDGVHAGIDEGIQVCRRTGKLECITCFREYATDVSFAADDLPMSLHHAGHVLATGNVRPDFDRRWAGASEQATIQLLSGQLDAAEQSVGLARELAETFHSPIRARISTFDYLETIRLLQGHAEPLAGDPPAPPELPDGESPLTELRRDARAAIRFSLLGDHGSAIKTLSAWDRRLSERKCLSRWFETRLRLIATYRLAGQSDRAEALAKPLEARAREARDWLTLRRLARLRDPAEMIDPTAAIAPLSSGPWAPARSTAESVPDARGAEPERAPSEPPETPLQALFNRLTERLSESNGEPEKLAEIRDTILKNTFETVTHPTDAARLIYLVPFTFTDVIQAPGIWDWAEALAAPFPESASVLIGLGILADWLRDLEGSPLAERIAPGQVEALVRRAIDLAPEHAGIFSRAGGYYSKQGNSSEAERCYARSFRLARANADTALRLANLYRQTDRARDALAVLDMNLREGSNTAEVAWQAAMLAHSLDQDDAMITYLDLLESIEPGRIWANHYRASGLIRMDRPAEALEALEEETRRNQGEARLNVAILKACAFAALNRLDEFRQSLAEVLGTKLSAVDHVSHAGLVQLFGRLWPAANAVLPADDPLGLELETRELETGFSPNELFDFHRKSGSGPQTVNFYECLLVQPLDEHWPSHNGCLVNQQGWTRYEITWGVLAASEEEAGQTALAWQARCYPLAASIGAVHLGGEGYNDYPGAVWQGGRTGYSE